MEKFTWVCFFGLCAAVSLVAGTQSKKYSFVVCKRSYKKLGCFEKKQHYGMDLLISDRDFKGHELDWGQFKESIHSLVCRCTEKARAEGYKFIAIRFWAECWAGKDLDDLPTIMQKKSNKCANHKQKACNDLGKKECVGSTDYTQYLYTLPSETAPIEATVTGSQWSQWTRCSRSCGRRRTMPCVGKESPCFDKKITEKESCNMGECVKPTEIPTEKPIWAGPWPQTVEGKIPIWTRTVRDFGEE